MAPTPSMRSCAMSFVILVITAGAYVSPAAAQGTVGAITGTVVDPIGAVLPGAAVTVTSTGTNEVRTTFTDGAGVYVVANLTAGTYRVEVQLQGFNRFARIDAQVQADTVTRVDVTLALGDFAATVAVTAERRTTDVQKTPVPVTVLSGRELEEKGVERMADLQFATPLMTVDNAALTQNVTIRGIGLKSGSPRASSGVAVYRDGVLVPPILNQTSFFDIGSVETLRGPQGTFAGSYSTGGAVYINSRDPDFNGVSGYVDTGAQTYRRLRCERRRERAVLRNARNEDCAGRANERFVLRLHSMVGTARRRLAVCRSSGGESGCCGSPARTCAPCSKWRACGGRPEGETTVRARAASTRASRRPIGARSISTPRNPRLSEPLGWRFVWIIRSPTASRCEA